MLQVRGCGSEFRRPCCRISSARKLPGFPEAALRGSSRPEGGFEGWCGTGPSLAEGQGRAGEAAEGPGLCEGGHRHTRQVCLVPASTTVASLIGAHQALFRSSTSFSGCAGADKEHDKEKNRNRS